MKIWNLCLKTRTINTGISISIQFSSTTRAPKSRSISAFDCALLLLINIIMNDNNDNTESCSMTGLLGILIQLGLGFLSFSVLIVKRLREKPQRPWKIWLFDTSKQIISQLLAHFINLTISIALSYNDDSSDECLWYFMTNILDNTLGVLICVMCLRGIEWSLVRRNRLQYVSGNYYTKKKVIVEI